MMSGAGRHIAIAAALLLSSCTGCGNTDNSPEAADTAYSVVVELSGPAGHTKDADTVRLGRMSRGEVISQTIGIRNNHTQPVAITGIETSCGCTTVDYPKRPIKPGETQRMTFRFDSKGEYGMQFKYFYILTSIDSYRYKVYLLGEVI